MKQRRPRRSRKIGRDGDDISYMMTTRADGHMVIGSSPTSRQVVYRLVGVS